MKKKFKLGVIGCGNMGSAIVRGAVLSDYLNAKKVIVCDVLDSVLDSVAETGVYTCNSNRYTAENSEYLLFAVRPQQFDAVVKSLGGYKPEKIISVMAHVSRATIKNKLGASTAAVARCMPNLPCSIGSGAIGIDMYDFDGDADSSDFIFNIFNSLGTVLSLSEDKMDAVTGVSGSGPAYTFMFIDSLIDAGVKQGLTKDEAKLLAAQTVMGAAEMVLREENSVSDLIMKVCSKGGPTVEAVKTLEENNFRAAVYMGVAASVNKCRELTK